jgi:hypothetical protein
VARAARVRIKTSRQVAAARRNLAIARSKRRGHLKLRKGLKYTAIGLGVAGAAAAGAVGAARASNSQMANDYRYGRGVIKYSRHSAARAAVHHTENRKRIRTRPRSVSRVSNPISLRRR